MAFESDPGLLAMLGLRLKGFAEADAIAGLVRRDTTEVQSLLEGAAKDEFTQYRDGRRSGWTLLPEGRKEIERRASAELDEVGCREIVQAAYEDFLKLNGEMLAVCTRWQVKDAEAQVLNDHEDPDYDAAVIAELAGLDDGVQPICATLSGLFERFSIYAPRFTESLDKVRSGDQRWFTAPMIESYHTVWFELHEDLLATLGIDRASENAH